MNEETRTGPSVRAGNRLVAVSAAAALMAVIDGTIVTASLRVIGEDLRATLSTGAWFTAAYLVAAGITMPLSGWIIGRWTPRRTLLASLVLFVAGSVLCALAWNPLSLIIFRVIQGLGGGLLEPVALTIAASTAGPARMGRVMGVVSAVINVAPVVGPLAGGLLAGTGHWQLIFLINVPLGMLVLVGALRLMSRDSGESPTVERPDMAGVVLLPAGVVSLMLGIEQVASHIWAWIPIAAGVALLTGYAIRTVRGNRPAVLDLRLLALPGVRGGLGVMAVVGFTMYFQLVALPLWAPERHGMDGVAAGVPVAVLGVGLLVSMTLSGRWSDVVGPRIIVTSATIGTAVLAAVFAVAHNRIPIAAALVLLVILGLAFGAVAAPAFAGVYRAVPADRVPYVTPSLFITVQLCAAVGANVAAQLVYRHSADHALTLGYWSIAAAMILAALIARGLPGRAAAG